ncbi:MAG: hypothetical protein AAFN13_04795 [Bacteroidota bacterium]
MREPEDQLHHFHEQEQLEGEVDRVEVARRDAGGEPVGQEPLPP